MALMNLKGQLSEMFLNEYFESLRSESVIEDFEWHLEGYDFSVQWNGRLYTMECKNLRKDDKGGRDKIEWWVELQRTRDSKKGLNTRGYKVGYVDVIAACLFNRSGEWKYRFAATSRLPTRNADNTLLDITQPVPKQPSNLWHDDLTKAFKDVQ